MTSRPALRIVGRGRAGGSFAAALGAVGWPVDLVGREAGPAALARDVDVVLLCVPDGAVAALARAIEPSDEVVVAHCAGSLGLDVLAPHRRRASIHPLVALPSAERGAELLRGAWFAVSGDPVLRSIVEALDGLSVDVADDDRTAYHAAAVIASNHLVALLGQVDRIARGLGIPLDAYLDLVRGTVDNVERLGAADALTGPVARGDWDTVRRHLDELPMEERATYVALAREAARLVGRDAPDLGT